MASIRTIPPEIGDMISGFLDLDDLINLSLASHGMRSLVHYEWGLRLKAKWETNTEILINAYTAGHVSVVRKLFEIAHVDPNLGIAITTIILPYFGEDVLNQGSSRFSSIPANTPVMSIDKYCRCPYLQDNASLPGKVLVQLDASFDGSSLLPGDHHEDRDGCQTQLIFPLHFAAACGHAELIEILVSHGALLEAPCHQVQTHRNIQDFTSYRPSRRHDESIPSSLEVMVFKMMLTPLFLAVNHGHLEAADLLLQYGASANLCPDPSRSLSVFHVAVGVQGIEMAQLCIDRGIYDINELNYAGLPPIWLAYLNNNWGAVNLLNHLGANINHDLSRGFTPLVHAILIENYDSAKKLIVAGSKVDTMFVDGPPAFLESLSWTETDHRYSHLRRLTPLEILIKRAFSFPSISELNHFWSMRDFSAIAEFIRALVARGLFNVNETNAEGLGLAVSLFDRRSTKYLGYQNEPGDSSHCRHLSRHREPSYPWRYHILETLLDLGTEPMATDQHGNNLLQLSISEWDFETYKLICRYAPGGTDLFDQYWDLSKVMNVFAWPQERTSFGGRCRDWSHCARACLETLLELGLTEGGKIVNHSSYTQILCESLWDECDKEPGNGELSRLAEFLIGLSPSATKVTLPYEHHTPLYHAITTARAKIVRMLLSVGVSPNEKDRSRDNQLPVLIALHSLYDEGEPWGSLGVLVENGAKVHLPIDTSTSTLGGSNSNPILSAIQAMSYNAVPENKSNKRKGAPVSMSESRRATPEDKKVEEGYRRKLKIMLEFNPIKSLPIELEREYVWTCCELQNTLALSEVCQYGANPDVLLDGGHTSLTRILNQILNLDLPETDKSQVYSWLPTIGKLVLFGADIHQVPRGSSGKSAADCFREVVVGGCRMNNKRSSKRHKSQDRLRYLLKILVDSDWVRVKNRDVVLATQRNMFYPSPYHTPKGIKERLNKGLYGWRYVFESDSESGKLVWNGPPSYSYGNNCFHWSKPAIIPFRVTLEVLVPGGGADLQAFIDSVRL